MVLKDSSIMGQLPLIALFSSFLFWMNFYFLLSIINKHHSAEWNCRIVTFVHGSIITMLTATSVFITGPWPFSYVGKPSTDLHIAIVIISTGYFIFDFMWCIWHWSEGPVMLAHHMVSLFGFSYVLYTGMNGSELTAVLGGSEATNPFLQTRWFMKEMKLYRDKLAMTIDCVFVALFLFLRVGVGTAFHYRVQTDPTVALIPKLGGQAFYIISIIFSIQLVIFFSRKYILKRKRSSKNATNTKEE